MKEPDIEMNLKKIMERIKWIRETKAILSKEEISLSIPLMQDLSQVGNIYDKFMSLHTFLYELRNLKIPNFSV